MTTQAPRRWFAFRLRTLFIAVAVVACLAWLLPWAVRSYLPDNIISVFFHDTYITFGNPPR